MIVSWKRFGGYEISSLGDKRFSAFNARFPTNEYSGRTIEQVYQCDVKGYDLNGTQWKLGKGKPPLNDKSKEELWNDYLGLWKLWSTVNRDLLRELYIEISKVPNNFILSDRFATTDINQAHALSEILNEYIKYRGPNPADDRYFCAKAF